MRYAHRIHDGTDRRVVKDKNYCSYLNSEYKGKREGRGKVGSGGGEVKTNAQRQKNIEKCKRVDI